VEKIGETEKDRPEQQRLGQLWDKRGQAHMWCLQGGTLLQQGLSEPAMEEWPQGSLHFSGQEATSSSIDKFRWIDFRDF
jgi:hypothetical protein